MTYCRAIGSALSTMLLLFAAPAAADEKRFGFTSFERIILNGDFAVEVTHRAPINGVATGPRDALDRIEMRSTGGTLTISDRRFGSNRQRGAGPGPVVIRVNAANLRSATVTGAGSLTIDRLAGTKVELVLSGPGALIVRNITADRLALRMVGNGSMTLAGKVKVGTALVSGAGNVDASALAVTDLAVQGQGAADQRYQAARTAEVTLRGVGRIAVTGKAKCTVRNLGTGTVACGQP